MFQGEQSFYLAGFPLETAVDPTGAGDAFAGAFMGSLSSLNKTPDWSALQQAVAYGSVLGSFCVERFGVDGIADLAREKIDQRYQHFITFLNKV